MNSILRRRRALMGAKGKSVKPTKLTEGSYTRGASSWSVDSAGKASVSPWSTNAVNGLVMPLDTPISIKSGDVIELSLLRQSGSPGNKRLDVQLYKSSDTMLLSIYNNSVWNLSSNNSQTVTSSIDGNVTHIYMNNRSATIDSSVNYSFKFKMTINGKVVLE